MFEAAPVVPAALAVARSINVLSATFSNLCPHYSTLMPALLATFLIASGGVYQRGTPTDSYDFVEPYPRATFHFVGVVDTDFIVAGGAVAVMSGKIDRATFLKPFDEAVDSLFKVA